MRIRFKELAINEVFFANTTAYMKVNDRYDGGNAIDLSNRESFIFMPFDRIRPLMENRG